MNLSNKSQKIIQYCSNHSCFHSLPNFTKKTLSFLSLFYLYFQRAEAFVKNQSIILKKMNTIPYPQSFPIGAIDEEVLKKIKQLKYTFVFQTIIFGRNITIYFVNSKSKSYMKEVKFILSWLYILNICCMLLFTPVGWNGGKSFIYFYGFFGVSSLVFLFLLITPFYKFLLKK